MASLSSATRTSNQVNFTAFAIDLEKEITNTRNELNFLKKEIHILNCEKDTIEEMTMTKMNDINKYLTKEITYLEESINKAQVKQKAENSRFVYQC